LSIFNHCTEHTQKTSYLISTPCNCYRFLYTDELDVDSVRKAKELINISYRYGPQTVRNRCYSYLQSEMSGDNVCTTLELAHTHNEQEIFDKCFHFILVNATDVFKATNFKDLCRECVKKILTSDDLNASEFDVYDAVVLWADGECSRKKTKPNDERRRDVLGDLLFSVRFALMDVDEFTHRLSMKEVLTSEEKVVLYQFFHGEVNKLPSEFNRTPRKQYKVRAEFANMEISEDGNIAPSSNKEDTKDRPRTVELPRKTRSKHLDQPTLRVLRYKDIGGPWEFRKGADAIRFQCSNTIVLRGVEIFGPFYESDTYTVDFTLTDDLKNDIRKEHFTVDARVPHQKTYDVILRNPVRVPAQRIFTVSVKIRGEASYQGLRGSAYVETEGVTFDFYSSNVSFNGTDVTVGQIPALLFSL